jgi:hypothetical protein
MYEQKIAALRIEVLHHTGPALIASSGGNHHSPTAAAIVSRGLHLDAMQPALKFSDQVYVGAVKDGNEQLRALACEPFHRRELALVALFARLQPMFSRNGGRGSIHGIDPTRACVTGGARNVPEW